MAELETEVKLLKKELEDQAKIHEKLDVAIEKLTDVSNSIHRMLAVHEEKIARQEEADLPMAMEIESCHDAIEYLQDSFSDLEPFEDVCHQPVLLSAQVGEVMLARDALLELGEDHVLQR